MSLARWISQVLRRWICHHKDVDYMRRTPRGEFMFYRRCVKCNRLRAIWS